MSAWEWVRFLHVLGAAVWVGGMIFLGAVAVPAARAAGGPERSRALITAVARRFGVLGGVAWLAIAVSGFALLDHRGVALADLPDSDYGRRVLAKIVLLLLVGAAALLHGLWQGPRVRRAQEAGALATARRWALVGAGLDSLMLLGSLAALWLATSLVA